MALAIRKQLATASKWLFREVRLSSTYPERETEQNQNAEKNQTSSSKPFKPKGSILSQEMLKYRYVYPEFLPDPNPIWRNSLREKLEREDMMARRNNIDIPEFYVGSILSVTTSDPHAQGKTNKFVGICIDRTGCGLRAEFVLRNIVDNQGVEVRYDQYDPAIQKIQVLKLEKRIDDHLYYLRDALPEYSTFSFDMDPEILPEGSPVPINSMQVKLKPRPWSRKWELQDLKGVSNIEEQLKHKQRAKRDSLRKPWEKYDLVKQYRRTIPEEEQSAIWTDVYTQLHQLQHAKKRMMRKRSFNLPKPKLV